MRTRLFHPLLRSSENLAVTSRAFFLVPSQWLEVCCDCLKGEGKLTCWVKGLKQSYVVRFWQACPSESCNKKVIDNGDGSYRCEKCSKDYNEFQHRLLLSVSYDRSILLWFLFWFKSWIVYHICPSAEVDDLIPVTLLLPLTSSSCTAAPFLPFTSYVTQNETESICETFEATSNPAENMWKLC